MRARRHHWKPKGLIWIWVLVISMVTPLLPVQQATVQAAGASIQTIGGYISFEGTDLDRAVSVVTDDSGKTYVGDSGNGCIVIYNTDGTEYGKIVDPEFKDYLSDLTIKNGILYVATVSNVFRYDLNNHNQQMGSPFYVAATGTYDIEGIVVDSEGNIFTSSYYDVVKTDPAGNSSRYLSLYDLGIHNGQAIAIDEDDNLYVLSSNQNVHKWNKDKELLASWIYGSQVYWNDGPTSKSGLSYSNGLLYIGASGFTCRGFFEVSATDGEVISEYHEDTIGNAVFNVNVNQVTKLIYVSYQVYSESTGFPISEVKVYKDLGTTTTASASSYAVLYGDAVTINVSVTANSEDGIPTGSVAIMDGSVKLADVNLVNGTASYTTTELPSGTRSIRAVYEGGGSYAGSSSKPILVDVAKVDTSTTVQTSNASVIWGEPLTFTAEVNGASPGGEIPTGTVKFKSGTTLLGTAELSAGKAVLHLSDLAVGIDTITAQYEGDDRFAASSNTVTQTVSKAATATTVAASQSASVYGEKVTFTATVTVEAPGSGTPTGNVTFKDGTEIAGTAALSGGVAALDMSGLSVGTHTITVVYSGDDSLLASDNSIQQTVAPAPAQAVSAVIATETPEAGADDEVTLTVKDSLGNTDTTFSGAHDVTMSGYMAAPDGSYGSFNGTALTAGPNTISVTFANGVATPKLKLNQAAAQTIAFSVADVAAPSANTLSLAPTAGDAVEMALTADVTAPASNGGTFAQQPAVTLLDAYGNTSTGDNSTVVTVSKKDTGAWTLTGTVTATASSGVAAFTDLGATNAAEVTGAQLSFEATGLAPIASQTVTLPWPGTAAPSVESVAAGDGHVLLTWSEVYGAVSYAVYQRTADGAYGAEVASVTGSVYDAVGLTNGTTYYFIVKAVNPSGISAASNEVSATPRTVPSAPTDVTAAAGNGQATVSFTAPANGGSAITHYEVTAMPGTITATGTESPITVTGLSNGVTYTFTVQAINSAGSGLASDASNSVKPSAPSSSGGTATSAPSVPSTPPLPPASTPDPEQPTVEAFNSGIVNGADLVEMMESKAAEAKDASVDFADIQGHWAEKSMTTFAKLHLIEGYEDGTMKPDGHITRAEFAVLLNRIFDIQAGNGTSIELKDVDHHWAEDAIENLVAAGIISGYGDGTIKPDNTITREEMAVMLSRLLNLSEVEKDATKGDFNDLNGSYAANAIKAEAQAGIISGKGNGEFDPKSNATRAEALQIILNALKLDPRLKALLDSLE